MRRISSRRRGLSEIPLDCICLRRVSVYSGVKLFRQGEAEIIRKRTGIRVPPLGAVTNDYEETNSSFGGPGLSQRRARSPVVVEP